MKQALNFAVKKGTLFYNVLDKVDAPNNIQFVGDYYTIEEAKTLFENTIVQSEPLYIIALLAMYYEFQRSEVLGLKWSCINFNEDTISIMRKVVVVKSKGQEFKLKDSNKLKTKSSRRTLPLIPIIAYELKKEKQDEEKRFFEKQRSGNPNNFVHVDCLGNLFKPNFVTTLFTWLLNKANMRHFRFHDLKHTCASLLILNGIPYAHVARWHRHGSELTTEKFYEHFDLINQQLAANKMTELLPINLDGYMTDEDDSSDENSDIWLDLGNLQVVQTLLYEFKVGSIE